MSFDSIDVKSSIENLKTNKVNQNVQHEEFLNQRCVYHNDVLIKVEIDLKKRSLNTEYDWLDKKEYSFNIK
jgi:hypothetical protein